jgi:hypothetical protein
VYLTTIPFTGWADIKLKLYSFIILATNAVGEWATGFG